jgi:hypothetical protein
MASQSKKKLSVIKSMTEQELNQITESICSSSKNIRKKVTEIALVEGWLSKNYDNFKQYCVTELADDISYDTLNRQRRVGECEFNLAGRGAIGLYKAEPIMQIVEAKLEPKQQKEVWQYLKKVCGGKLISSHWLTTKRVTKALVKLGFVDSDKDEEAELGSDSSSTKPDVQLFNNSGDESDEDLFDDSEDDNPVSHDQNDNQGQQKSNGIKKRTKPEVENSDLVEREFFECIDGYSKDEMEFEKSVACSIKETFEVKDLLNVCSYLLSDIDIAIVKRLYRHLKNNAE